MSLPNRRYNARSVDTSYRRDTADYPSISADPVGAVAAQRVNPEYTGTEVKGVLLLPKQAYTPVTSGENADPKRR